jgi:hypothetical protein
MRRIEVSDDDEDREIAERLRELFAEITEILGQRAKDDSKQAKLAQSALGHLNTAEMWAIKTVEHQDD